MNGPASHAYDPRILLHPEYARSYHHYLGQGAPADEAARLAYAWTERTTRLQDTIQLPYRPAPRQRLTTSPNRNRRALGIATTLTALGTVGVVAAALASGGGPDSVTVSPEPTAAAASSSPSPPPSLSPSPEPLPSETPTVTPTTSPPAPIPTVASSRPAVPKKRALPAPPKRTVPATPQRRPPATAAPRSDCEPSYPSVCLRRGIGDYDCSSGTGNGPNYAHGPLAVRAPDPFDLDSDNDGIGCERG
jgi:hypothetical protein